MVSDRQSQFPEKYRTLLDAEMWAFIEETAKYYPDDAVSWPIEKQRQTYDALCAAFSMARPDDVEIHDSSLSVPAADGTERTVRLRHYTPVKAMLHAHVLYIHGGGFVLGGLDSHDSVCADIAHRTGLGITAVDYALAPEHVFPQDYQDCLAAFQHVSDQTGLPVILVGDSAGGTLCAALVHALRDEAVSPTAQVLIYPALGHDFGGASFEDHAHAPGLTVTDMEYYLDIRIRGDRAKLDDPRCSPSADSDVSGLPPTRIHTADCDPLRDDGLHYAAKLRDAGCDVEAHNGTGLIHGHLRARYSSKIASRAFSSIIDDIAALATRIARNGSSES